LLYQPVQLLGSYITTDTH